MRYISDYEDYTEPLIIARLPLMPAESIWSIYRAEDPEQALRTFFETNPEAVAAIAVSSAALRRELEEFLAGRPLKTRAAFLRLFAYASRMSVRTSPFGLFAGTGVVEAGKTTTLHINAGHEPTVQVRPDMAWLLECTARAHQDPKRGALTFHTNECTIERGGRLYICHPHRMRASQRLKEAVEPVPISIRLTEAVRYVREHAAGGIRLDALADNLSERFSAPRADAMRLLEQLIESGVIVSDLAPSGCADPVDHVIEKLLDAGISFASELRDAVDSVSAHDGTPVRDFDVRRIDSAAKALRDVYEVTFVPLQVDMYQQFTGALGTRVLKDVYTFAEYQLRCAPYLTMREYRERFIAKYEGNTAMVPLTELVDPDFGLGAPPAITDDSSDRAALDGKLLQLAAAALRDGHEEIALSRTQFEALVPQQLRRDALPRNFEMGFQIAARSSEEIERGEYLITPSMFISSNGTAKCAGRFLGGLPDDITQRLRHRVHQRHDDVIDAELTYLPYSPRMYNVSIRPMLYDYEIAFGVYGGTHNRLSLGDLYVTLEDERFTLWSRSLNKRVRVHETHVLSTERISSNLCRFLAMLSNDGNHNVQGFRWGIQASNLPSLPRLRVGNVVLALRTWNVPREAVEGDFMRWCAEWKVPRFAYLADADRRLALDLNSPLALELLRDQLEDGKRSVQLTEVLPRAEEHWLDRDGRKYAAEFVITMSAKQPRACGATPRAFHDETPAFGPASRWTYVKLYLGANRTEVLLSGSVAPLVQQMEASGLLDRWFFIRYGDPSPHVRLRVLANSDDGAVRERVLNACEAWLRGGDIDKYALDTYQPEYDRYGTASMAQAERLFWEDSRTCLALISAHAGEPMQPRIERAASSFFEAVWAICNGSQHAERWLRRIGSPQKLGAEDWLVIKKLRVEAQGVSPRLESTIEELRGFFDDVRRPEVFAADALHLHCNRLGLSGEDERRVFAIVWHAVKGRIARNESAPAMPARDALDVAVP